MIQRHTRFRFNLKRDASPLANILLELCPEEDRGFNLKRDASPLATSTASGDTSISCAFQSQARCQPPSDSLWHPNALSSARFNLKRDASPLAKMHHTSKAAIGLRFNLKRDASPLATFC